MAEREIRCSSNDEERKSGLVERAEQQCRPGSKGPGCACVHAGQPLPAEVSVHSPPATQPPSQPAPPPTSLRLYSASLCSVNITYWSSALRLMCPNFFSSAFTCG